MGCELLGLWLVACGIALSCIGISGYVFMCREHRKLNARAKTILAEQDAFWADVSEVLHGEAAGGAGR